MQPSPQIRGTLGGRAWVTIGSFDGVHLGHQHIIRSLVSQAGLYNSSTVVVTFFPHPQKVLRKIDKPFYLSTPDEKDRLLSDLGVDTVLTLHFDLPFSRTPAADFLRLLRDRLPFSHLLIGHDFTLGADREGNVAALERIGVEMGFQVKMVEPMRINLKTVSSSAVRDLLAAGDLATANLFLGRPYSFSGEVIHGDGRGKHIGIPTANLSVWKEKLVPSVGVYAAHAEVEEVTHPAVVNIGYRPTFHETSADKNIEVHILDFNQDIYGILLRLSLIERIRAEIKFSSAQDLMDQIHRDINHAKEILAHAPR